MYSKRKDVKVLCVCMCLFWCSCISSARVLHIPHSCMHQVSHCNVLFFGSVFHFKQRYLKVAMRRMKFQVEMICVASCVNKYLHLLAIAGFVLNSKVEGGCGRKLLVSELVAQIGLLEVVETTQ